MDEQTLALLAALLGKKGGADLSNILNDPFLSFVAGTYQGEPQMSEGEIYAREAPTLLSIQEMEPEGSWRKVAAGQIASGIPAYRVKEDLIAQYNDNPEVFGALTSKEALSFVDEIAAENQKAQNSISKQLEKKDYFQERGLPGAQARYSPEDVVRLMPEAFADIGNKIANPPAEIQAMLKRIQEAGKAPVMREQKPMAEVLRGTKRPQGALRSFLYGGSPSDLVDLPASEVYFDPSKDSATTLSQALEMSDYYGGKKYLGGLIPEKPLSALFGLYKGLTDIPKTAVGDLLGIREGESMFSPTRSLNDREQVILAREAEKQTLKDESGKPKKVVSKSATEARNRMLKQAAEQVSRMRGGEEYNRQYAAALANTLAGRLAESGRTPLGDAIVRQALAARAFRK